MIIVNVSNHSPDTWTQGQRDACKNLPILNIPFPYVDAEWGKPEIERLADRLVEKILHDLTERLGRPPEKGTAVHVMGEYTLTHNLVIRLKKMGFKTIASTTRRETAVGLDGKKKREFKFVRFREY